MPEISSICTISGKDVEKYSFFSDMINYFSVPQSCPPAPGLRSLTSTDCHQVVQLDAILLVVRSFISRLSVSGIPVAQSNIIRGAGGQQIAVFNLPA